MDTVNLIVSATFFAPIPYPWIRIILFAFGIYVFVGFHWYDTTKSRQTICKSFVLTARTCTLLVLLASWNWAEITIPFLVNTDTILYSLVNSFPENLTLTLNTNTSRLNFLYQGTDCITCNNSELLTNSGTAISPLGLAIDRNFLDASRLDVPQTPGVDWIHAIQTVGGYYEVWYRIVFGPWILAMKASELANTVIDVTEYRVGDRVMSGGRRLGESRRHGTVARVFPSTHLDRFKYEVEWDAEVSQRSIDGSTSETIDAQDQPTFEKALDLVPEISKIYFYPDQFRPVPQSEIPRDALAVFTQTNMTILEGFSHYYNQYWRYQKSSEAHDVDDILSTPPTVYRRASSTSPDKNPSSTSVSSSANDERMKQYFGKYDSEGTCRARDEATYWTEISPKFVERWKPLLAASTILCDRSDYVTWQCSRATGMQKLAQMKQSLYPLIGWNFPIDSGRHSNLANILQYSLWWVFFFSCQATVLICLTLLSVSFVFAPACYIIVNSLRHVDEIGNTFANVMHVSLRTYDSVALTYHFALAMLRSAPRQGPNISWSKWIAERYLMNFRYSMLAHWFVNCAILFKMRLANEAKYDLERKQQLEQRKKKKHLTLPRKRSCSQESLTAQGSVDVQENVDEPFCRICFSGEGQLVSPCCCDGSMRYVHLDCLSEWRFRSMHTESFVRCDQCRYRYKIRKTWLGATLRSSLCLSLLSLICMVGLCIVGIVFFKLLDWVLIGRRLSEYALGPKISYYVKEQAWQNNIPPANRMEKLFVETSSFYLGKFNFELGHLVCSFIAWGIIGFLTSDSYAVPWLWGTSDDTGSQEEGWFVYVGGRIGIVVCIGQYRLFSAIWNWLKIKTAKLISARETTLVPIEPLADEIKCGSILRTPYGKIKVTNYREEDDVLEGDLLDWPAGSKIYRRGSDVLSQGDVEEVNE